MEIANIQYMFITYIERRDSDDTITRIQRFFTV